jgi:hypothetical protein
MTVAVVFSFSSTTTGMAARLARHARPQRRLARDQDDPWSLNILDRSLHVHRNGRLVNDQSVGHWIRCLSIGDKLRSSIQFIVQIVGFLLTLFSSFAVVLSVHHCIGDI